MNSPNSGIPCNSFRWETALEALFAFAGSCRCDLRALKAHLSRRSTRANDRCVDRHAGDPDDVGRHRHQVTPILVNGIAFWLLILSPKRRRPRSVRRGGWLRGSEPARSWTSSGDQSALRPTWLVAPSAALLLRETTEEPNRPLQQHRGLGCALGEISARANGI